MSVKTLSHANGMENRHVVGPTLWPKENYLKVIGQKLCANLLSPLRINPTDFGGPLTFLLVQNEVDICAFISKMSQQLLDSDSL